MSEPLVVVVLDGTVTQGIVATAATIDEWREAGVLEDLFPGAELVDVSDVDPRPAIGWTRAGDAWSPPPAAEPVEAEDAGEPEETS